MSIKWTASGLTSLPTGELSIGIFTVAPSGDKWHLTVYSIPISFRWGGFGNKSAAQRFAEAVVEVYSLQDRVHVTGSLAVDRRHRKHLQFYKECREGIALTARNAELEARP